MLYYTSTFIYTFKYRNMNSVEKTESLQNLRAEMKSELAEVVARTDTIKNDLSQTRSAISHVHNQHDNLVQEQRNSHNSLSSRLKFFLFNFFFDILNL